MRRHTAAAIGIVAVLSACGAPAHDNAADLAAIGKVRDAYAAAWKAGDAAAMAALYTADGVVMNNEQPAASGTAAVLAANKGAIDATASRDVVITAEKTEISGDMAYDRGTFQNTMTPKNGPPTVEDGRYLVVLKRQADGSWKMVQDIGNVASAPMPAAASTKAPAKAPAKKP